MSAVSSFTSHWPPATDNSVSRIGSFHFIELGFEFIPLLAGHVEVEHQVFDVETQLREGILNENQEAAPAMDAVDDLRICGFEGVRLLHRQGGDLPAEFDDLARQFGP
jgi:hypothetical protein